MICGSPYVWNRSVTYLNKSLISWGSLPVRIQELDTKWSFIVETAFEIYLKPCDTIDNTEDNVQPERWLKFNE